MFQIIFQGIISLCQGIMVPINQVINQIIQILPGFSVVVEKVTDFLNLIVTFIPLTLDFLMIPRLAIVFLFDYYVIKYAIYLMIRGFRAGIVIYNKLKL